MLNICLSLQILICQMILVMFIFLVAIKVNISHSLLVTDFQINVVLLTDILPVIYQNAEFIVSENIYFKNWEVQL